MGYLNPTAGVLITTSKDQPGFRASVQVAVRQPSAGEADGPSGTFDFVQFDAGFDVSEPATTSSAVTTLPQVGSVTVDGADLASFTTEDALRVLFTVSGPAPQSDIPWSSIRTTESVVGTSEDVQLTPDGNGNHFPPGGDRWYGVSGDGRVLLGTVADPDSPTRGIFIGLR
jgi:hypothetical protein